MLITLIKGFIVGLGASIPLGPLGILCVQKTLSKGRSAGLITGLGAAVSDTLYAAISLLGLAFMQNLITENRTWVMLIGGAIIILIGIKVYLSNPIKQIHQKEESSRHFADFFEAFFMTISNPGAIFLILGLFTAVGINTTGYKITDYAVPTILWGVFMGAVTWWFILSGTINRFRRRFRIKQLIMFNKISGIVIAVLGIITFFDGLLELIIRYIGKFQ